MKEYEPTKDDLDEAELFMLKINIQEFCKTHKMTKEMLLEYCLGDNNDRNN